MKRMKSYGEILEFVKENDHRIINLTASLDADAIESEAQAHLNACGSGALAAAIGAAKAMGAQEGLLVEYSTSYDAMPEDPLTRVVGYAGIVLY